VKAESASLRDEEERRNNDPREYLAKCKSELGKVSKHIKNAVKQSDAMPYHATARDGRENFTFVPRAVLNPSSDGVNFTKHALAMLETLMVNMSIEERRSKDTREMTRELATTTTDPYSFPDRRALDAEIEQTLRWMRPFCLDFVTTSTAIRTEVDSEGKTHTRTDLSPLEARELMHKPQMEALRRVLDTMHPIFNAMFSSGCH